MAEERKTHTMRISITGEEIESIKRMKVKSNNPSDFTKGYNQALSDVLQMLKESGVQNIPSTNRCDSNGHYHSKRYPRDDQESWIRNEDY